MLGKLKTRKQFLHISNKGISVGTKGFALQAIQHMDPIPETPIQLGFTASKIIGNAIKRNKAKRRLRALANQYMSLYALEGYDYVLIGRKAILSRTYNELRKDLVYALHKCGLHKEHNNDKKH